MQIRFYVSRFDNAEVALEEFLFRYLWETQFI